MSPRATRWATYAAALLVGGTSGTLLLTSPAGAADGRCAAGTGVTVVVDYGPLGGGTDLGCDPNGGGKTAKDVMPPAGFTPTYVNGQPFVCRINGLPGQDAESCDRTPPEDAYWGLFWSDGTSSTWHYSSEGVGSLDVPEGGSIGWRFQDGGSQDKPSQPPTAAAAPSPEPPSRSPDPKPSKKPSDEPSDDAKPTPTPTPTPTPSASAPPHEGTPSEEAKPGGKADRPKEKGDRARKQPRDKAKPTPTPEPSESASPPAVEDDLRTASSPGDTDGAGGGGALTLVAGAAVLLLAGAAGLIAWRRRS